MREMLDGYRLEINKLENGYTTRRNNENPSTRVFTSLEDLLDYVKKYFEEDNQ